MKKNNIILIMLTITVIFGVSCIKDKNFDNNVYGITDPQNTAKGVSFVLARKARNSYGLDAVSSTPQILNDVVVVNLENGTVPSKDVTVNYVVDNTIIDAYNTANNLTGASMLQAFAPGDYSLPSTSIKVLAGSRLGQIPLTIPSTVSFNLNNSYALGLKIVSNDGGYTIAENLKNLLLVFNLKNKYDGVYKLSGHHNRVPYNFDYVDVNMEMRTSGANSVSFYYVAMADYGHPIGTSPTAQGWYGPAIAPQINFDPATGNVLSVQNNGGPTPIAMFTGAGSYTSKWVNLAPQPNKIFVCFNYNNNPLRAFFDTLTFVRSR